MAEPDVERARRKGDAMLEIDHEDLEMPNVCVPGILGGAWLFALAFGSLSLLLEPKSQLILQTFGGALGAYGMANMHKAKSISSCRDTSYFGGRALSFGCDP